LSYYWTNKEPSCKGLTLFTNPNIPDRLLETLYTRTEVFANLKDRVWLYIVEASRFNPRLNLDKSNDYSPDLRFRGLHNDIFGLTEIAPVSVNSLLILSSLIGNLDLNIIDRPNVSFKKINSVLARWKDLVKEKKFSDGYYTHLSLEEEFRCLIALIYGQGSYWDSKNKLYEFINNEDIALRCIYYANAEMNVKEMEVAFKLDDSVFIYAMLHNDKWIYDTHKHQRIFLEEHIWGGEVIKKYMQRCEQIQKKFKTFDTYPITDIMRDLYKESNYAPNKFEFNTVLLEDINRDLIKRVDKIIKKILGLFFFIIILLCINFFFK